MPAMEYDRPSSIFGQFSDDRIALVAASLDQKLEDLAARRWAECLPLTDAVFNRRFVPGVFGDPQDADSFDAFISGVLF